MAIQWNFNADQYEERDFAPIPQGDHRVRIKEVEEKTSANGNDMLKITLEVSGHASSLWYYLVFLKDNPAMVNQKLGDIYNSFGIQKGNMNTQSWINKVGAARVKHEMYNGDVSPKVSYFIKKEKQDSLPAWKDAPGKASVTGGGEMTPVLNSEDIPF